MLCRKNWAGATRGWNGWTENLMLTGKGIQMLQLQGRSSSSVMSPGSMNGTPGFTNRYFACLYVTLKFLILREIIIAHSLLSSHKLPSLNCSTPSHKMLKTFIISGWPLFSETVLVMVIHHWLASSFFLSFRIGSKRSRQDTNSQICLVNAPIGLFSFLAGKLKFMLFCSNADLLSLGVRYKIYIEGSAWSVSEKYILACDSMTLVVTPKYYDFYSRVLMPMQHYWPVQDDNKCSSIKFAVDWGNSHKQKVFVCYMPFIYQ